MQLSYDPCEPLEILINSNSKLFDETPYIFCLLVIYAAGYFTDFGGAGKNKNLIRSATTVAKTRPFPCKILTELLIMIEYPNYFHLPSYNSEWLELYAMFTTIGILRGILKPRRMPIIVNVAYNQSCQICVSAKNHELGYSIIINNSVIILQVALFNYNCKEYRWLTKGSHKKVIFLWPCQLDQSRLQSLMAVGTIFFQLFTKFIFSFMTGPLTPPTPTLNCTTAIENRTFCGFPSSVW